MSYVENPKEAIEKQLKLKEFNKVAGYKINIQKSVVFLYTTKLRKMKIKKTIAFTTASKRIKT